MAEQHLNGSQIDPALDEVCGEGVPQGMAADSMDELCPPPGFADRASQRAGIDMMPANVACFRIARPLPGGEQELPTEISSRKQ